ncbi:hypothetical protein [Lentzea sp. NPDC004782]|uniref:hypothetical protein n=1 Tax=Lentzea sp. NPDC004782 TaxID=3154458 RepID=UPI0033BD0533
MKGSFIHPRFRKGPFIDNARRVGTLSSGISGGLDFAGALHVGSMKEPFIPNLHTAQARSAVVERAATYAERWSDHAPVTVV